jgi:hypothetical protein
MLGLALASFAAWLLAPSEGYKMLAGLLTFGLVIVAGLTTLGCLLEWKPGKRLILLALLASLASCVGELELIGRDLDKIVADMAHFNCLEARRIAQTGHGFGRNWEPAGEGRWRALPRGAAGYHEIYLEHRPEGDSYALRVAMPDMPSARVDCRPNPAAPPEYVSLIN